MARGSRFDVARSLKRLVDGVGAAVGLAVAAPLMAGVAAVVWKSVGGPVVFAQERPGFDGRPFRLYKFRTMTNATDTDGALLPDAERLTPLGSMLRRWSVDELPELWNVLRGDMSLVGPRPLLMDYLDLYSDEQMRRHEMRPGLTGLAQISGRNDQSWEERLALDVWYVDHWSLWLDARILVLTVFEVFSGHGVSARDHATMPTFEGGGSSSVTVQPAFGWRRRRDDDARRLMSSVFRFSGPRRRTRTAREVTRGDR